VAHDFCEPSAHLKRLQWALAAVQGFNLEGLQTIAPRIFVEDYMQANMMNASSSADKVNNLYARCHLIQHVVVYSPDSPLAAA
jgi:hypothetical protein